MSYADPPPFESLPGPTPQPPKAPVEAKTVAGTAGAGVGAVIGAFINWLLDSYVLTPGTTGDLPTPVTMLVLLASAGAVTFASAYWARHTARPDLPAGKR